ncbi:MAG: GNAT family N-acetyltransferase [Defluviitaleaceae bacterium]|nr:GNAT family N-acetyltransferase [Defluviitaleaceae bacterium]
MEPKISNSNSIIPMIEEYAHQISQWKYDGIFSFYNPSQEDSDELMDGTYFVCIDQNEMLIGNYCFGKNARIPTVEENVYDDGFLDIGLGLKPDLCGKGYGLSFFIDGLKFAQKTFNTNDFRLSVATFNERAIKVYKKAGFYIEHEVTNSYYDNKFFIMKCKFI